MTNDNNRIRATVLAALLVISVFAIGGVAMAGSAAADGGEERTIGDYADEETNTIELDGVLEAVGDYREGVIDINLLLDVIEHWRSGEPVGQWITGEVTDQTGTPIEGATVTAEATERFDAQAAAGVTTNENGAYTIAVDEPGTYSVGVEYAGERDDETVEVAAGETASVGFELELEFEAGTIEGTVTDVDGTPVADAVLVDRFGEVLATTDDDGTYTVDVEPGETTLRATAAGYQDAGLLTVAVGEGETVDGVDFALDGKVEFDLTEIDGVTYTQNSTFAVEAGLDVTGEFDDDEEFAIRLNADDPDGEPIDLTSTDDFTVENVFIPGLGIGVDAEELLEDNVEEGVFYVDETVTGAELNAVDGEQPAEVWLSVDAEAELGTYTFESALVEFDADADGESQTVREIERKASADFGIAPETYVNLESVHERTFERGETYTVDAGLVAGEGYEEDAEFSLLLFASGPDDEYVDLTSEDGFTVDDGVFIPALGVEADIIADNVAEGVFYVNETVTGDELNQATGEQHTELTVTIDNEAATGEYSFAAVVVEFDADAATDESQAVRALNPGTGAVFEVTDGSGATASVEADECDAGCEIVIFDD